MKPRNDFSPLGVGGTHTSPEAGWPCWIRQMTLNSAFVGRRYSAADSAAAFASVRALNAEHCEPAFTGPGLW